MKKYIISPVTTYNPWEDLYETKIALDESEMPLLFICCGKTQLGSRVRAEDLVEVLELSGRNV